MQPGGKIERAKPADRNCGGAYEEVGLPWPTMTCAMSERDRSGSK